MVCLFVIKLLKGMKMWIQKVKALIIMKMAQMKVPSVQFNKELVRTIFDKVYYKFLPTFFTNYILIKH